MENRYFSPEETILTITDRYPELIPFLVSKGFTLCRMRRNVR